MRRPRASSQRGTRAAVELPPDPLGGPARSWLTARSARRCATDRTKAGPGAATAVIGAPRGARVPQGTSHKDFALFGAPSPLTLRTRYASRQGASMPAVTVQQTPYLPLVGRSDAVYGVRVGASRVQVANGGQASSHPTTTPPLASSALPIKEGWRQRLGSVPCPGPRFALFSGHQEVIHAAIDWAEKDRDRRDFAYSGRVRPRAA